MQYEIVTLKQKTMVGITARTSNSAPDMGMLIGGLWQRLFEKRLFFSIPDKANDFAVGLYSGYSGHAHDEYDVTVGCEVTRAERLPEGAITKVIPAGRYAKFVVFGDKVTAVAGAWEKIWTLPLPRSFTGDFEEYVHTEENGDCEVHMYVALR